MYVLSYQFSTIIYVGKLLISNRIACSRDGASDHEQTLKLGSSQEAFDYGLWRVTSQPSSSELESHSPREECGVKTWGQNVGKHP